MFAKLILATNEVFFKSSMTLPITFCMQLSEFVPFTSTSCDKLCTIEKRNLFFMCGSADRESFVLESIRIVVVRPAVVRLLVQCGAFQRELTPVLDNFS